MATGPAQIHAPLGFTKAEDVAPDHEREGMLRARTVPFSADPEEAFEFHSFPLRDLASPDVPEPGLEHSGFQTIDLSGNAELQAALATVRAEDRLSDDAAAAVRASLADAHLPLGDGRALRVDHVAADGMIQRRAGPSRLDVNPGGMDGANGHAGARIVHADQDVFGTPLKQMMKGEAPKLFRHQTPDGRNDDSSLFLLNLWIPIQQTTRPLVLMDRRSLDAKRHQLRYGLPVTRFLERNEEMKVNDIWGFRPDPAQEWYFRSEMGPDQAYVFDTLGSPHGATILPGEEILARLYEDLDRACDAIENADVDALREIASEDPPALPDMTTLPTRDAWERMTTLLAEAKNSAADLCASGDAWMGRARAAMDGVIRKSLEMRLVATLTASRGEE